MNNQSKKKDPIRELSNLNINEISDKTNIDVACLKAILSGDFEFLLGKNVRAYIKILEREFGFDLSEWMEKFNEFCKQNSISSQTTLIPIYRENIYKKESQSGEKWLILLLSIAAIIGAIFYFKLYRIFDLFLDKNDTIEYTKTQIVEKVENNLIKVGVSVPKFDENNSLIGVTQDENKSLNALDKSIIKQDENLSSDQNTTRDVVKPQILKAQILPKSQLYVMVTDLELLKKRGVLVDKVLDLNLSKEQLISAAHSNFVLKSGDANETKFKGKDRVRFYIKNGEIKQISSDEYQRLQKVK